MPKRYLFARSKFTVTKSSKSGLLFPMRALRHLLNLMLKSYHIVFYQAFHSMPFSGYSHPKTKYINPVFLKFPADPCGYFFGTATMQPPKPTHTEPPHIHQNILPEPHRRPRRQEPQGQPRPCRQVWMKRSA